MTKTFTSALAAIAVMLATLPTAAHDRDTMPRKLQGYWCATSKDNSIFRRSGKPCQWSDDADPSFAHISATRIDMPEGYRCKILDVQPPERRGYRVLVWCRGGHDDTIESQLIGHQASVLLSPIDNNKLQLIWDAADVHKFTR